MGRISLFSKKLRNVMERTAIYSLSRVRELKSTKEVISQLLNLLLTGKAGVFKI